MATNFPSLPKNGQIININGKTFQYDNSINAWLIYSQTSANVIVADSYLYSNGAPVSGSGPIGYTGSKGTTGTTGYTGSIGSLGYTGSAGADGTIGVDGYTGSIGYTGSQGTVGYVGSAGADGTIGVDGYTGSIGYTGSVGLTNWTTITANYTASAGDRLMLDSTAGEFYLTLPATPSTGAYIQATDVGDLSANVVVLGLNGSTLEGNAYPLSLDLSDTTYELIYDGTTWHITSTTGAQGAAGYTGSSGVGSLPAWQIVTANYTAVNGDRIFVDTSTASITITLPSSATLSNEVTIVDAESNAANNNITVSRNGSNINGLAEDLIIDVNASATTLTYYNTSRGWVITS